MEYNNKEKFNLEVSKPEGKIIKELFKKCTRAITNSKKLQSV